MEQIRVVPNYVRGEFSAGTSSRVAEVVDPATAAVLARVPLSAASDVDSAAASAYAAFPAWRDTPAVDRVQYLFRLKSVLHDEFEDLARTITLECGKRLANPGRSCSAPSRTWKLPAGFPL